MNLLSLLLLLTLSCTLYLPVVTAFGLLLQHPDRASTVRHTTQSPYCFTLRSSSSSSSNNNNSVESLSLDVLGENHDEVGDGIASSVQRMLDTEWMPQTIHLKMGQQVKQSYIKVRTTTNKNNSNGNSNDDDDDDMIMTIMTTVADDLIANWKEYDQDAFVNAWDVANYVSDYLTTKVNGNDAACGCSSKIY
jgi:hypothetical protein